MLKDLHGTATRSVPASLEQCVALLRAVERYPDWYPEAVRAVDIVERDHAGQALRARTQLHLSWGPVVKEFDLVLAVAVDPPGTIRLTRVSDKPSANTFDVVWHARDGDTTDIELGLQATLDVPRFLPLVGIGDAIAGGFVDAAARALAY